MLGDPLTEPVAPTSAPGLLAATLLLALPSIATKVRTGGSRMSRANWNIIAIAVAVGLVLLAGPWFMEQMRSLPSARHLSARSGQRILALEVIGLTSAADARRVQTRLAATPGVAACEVRLAQKRAYVVLDATLPDSLLLHVVHGVDARLLARVVQQ